MKLSLSFSRRLVLLILLLLLGLLLSGGMQFVLQRVSDNAVAVMRISAVCQGFFAFILPAVVVSIFVTRLPAEFLMIKRFPSLKSLGLAIAALLIGFPAIEWINSLSESLPWSQSVFDMEAEAQLAVTKMLGPHNVPNLLVSILVVGVLTGLAEELFFRGALQRIFQTRPMSVHAAIWISAIIFSLMHAQPVGFVPRVLLGALFGYAAVWTGSLWTAVLLHILNNTCTILSLWFGFTMPDSPLLGVISAVLTCAVLCLLRRSATLKDKL